MSLPADQTLISATQAVAESALAQHGPEILRRVTCDNAARIYGFQTR